MDKKQGKLGGGESYSQKELGVKLKNMDLNDDGVKGTGTGTETGNKLDMNELICTSSRSVMRKLRVRNRKEDEEYIRRVMTEDAKSLIEDAEFVRLVLLAGFPTSNTTS